MTPEDTTGESNDEWYEKNIVDLVQRYPRQWIAVLDRQVLCVAATRRAAQAEARRLAQGREFSVYFVEETPLPL